MKERLKVLIARYGRVFLGVYVLLPVASYAGFFEAIGMTFDVDTTGEGMGAVFGAWLVLLGSPPNCSQIRGRLVLQ